MDVLIDLALDRKPQSKAAVELMDLLERRVASGYMAWHTASNFYYLVSPVRGAMDARSFLTDLVSFIEIAPTRTDHLRMAATLAMRDFEDALQVAAAVACGADVIATRNVRDYKKAPIEAVAPGALIARLT